MDKEQRAVEQTAKTDELVRIELVTRELTNSKTNKKFIVYKAVQKDGKYIDCKFRKEVTPPVENAYVNVYKSQMNIASNQKYPVLWIKRIESIESIESVEYDTGELPF